MKKETKAPFTCCAGHVSRLALELFFFFVFVVVEEMILVGVRRRMAMHAEASTQMRLRPFKQS